MRAEDVTLVNEVLEYVANGIYSAVEATDYLAENADITRAEAESIVASHVELVALERKGV